MSEGLTDRQHQIELWRRTKAGDRAAYDELALAVLPFARKKAREYARMYKLDAEDLAQEGMSRLHHAVKYFKPELGWTFLNFFASACTRRMNAVARHDTAHRTKEIGEHDPATTDKPESATVKDLLRNVLTPLQIHIWDSVNGITNTAETPRQVAQRLGLSQARFATLLATANTNIVRVKGQS